MEERRADSTLKVFRICLVQKNPSSQPSLKAKRSRQEKAITITKKATQNVDDILQGFAQILLKSIFVQKHTVYDKSLRGVIIEIHWSVIQIIGKSTPLKTARKHFSTSFSMYRRPRQLKIGRGIKRQPPKRTQGRSGKQYSGRKVWIREVRLRRQRRNMTRKIVVKKPASLKMYLQLEQRWSLNLKMSRWLILQVSKQQILNPRTQMQMMKMAMPLQTGKSLANSESFSTLSPWQTIMKIMMLSMTMLVPIHRPSLKYSQPVASILLATCRRYSLASFCSSSSYCPTQIFYILSRYSFSICQILSIFSVSHLGVGTMFLAYFLCFFNIFLWASWLASRISDKQLTQIYAYSMQNKYKGRFPAADALRASSEMMISRFQIQIVFMRQNSSNISICMQKQWQNALFIIPNCFTRSFFSVSRASSSLFSASGPGECDWTMATAMTFSSHCQISSTIACMISTKILRVQQLRQQSFHSGITISYNSSPNRISCAPWF